MNGNSIYEGLGLIPRAFSLKNLARKVEVIRTVIVEILSL